MAPAYQSHNAREDHTVALQWSTEARELPPLSPPSQAIYLSQGSLHWLMDLPDLISSVPKQICWCCVACQQQMKQYFNRLNSHFPLNGHFLRGFFFFCSRKESICCKTYSPSGYLLKSHTSDHSLFALAVNCCSCHTKKNEATSLMQTKTASMLKFSCSFF